MNNQIDEVTWWWIGKTTENREKTQELYKKA